MGRVRSLTEKYVNFFLLLNPSLIKSQNVDDIMKAKRNFFCFRNKHKIFNKVFISRFRMQCPNLTTRCTPRYCMNGW